LSWSSCQQILTEDLNMKRVSAKIHPTVVDRGSKSNNLNVCYDLREQDGNDPQILSKVVTWDEIWCYGYDPETKQASSQWKTPNSPKPKKAWEVQSDVKIMLISFFDANGIVHKEFVPPGQTVNQQFYLKVLKTLRDSVRKKRPEMWSSSDWFLHNAPCPHGLECAAFFGKKEHDGYPSSSLFIWPCAMRLFPVPSYERPSGKHFANVSEVKKKMPEVLNISTEEFLEMFSAVGKRLVQVYQVKRRVLWSRLEL